MTSLEPSGKVGLHLNIRDHLRYALHYLVARQYVTTRFHQRGDGFAIARAFHNKGADQRDRFRIIELNPARKAAFGNQRGGEQQQLVFFLWGVSSITFLLCLPDTRRTGFF